MAYHEVGHAMVALSLPGTDPVQKISIIPRGIAALGYTMQFPTEDRFLLRKTEILTGSHPFSAGVPPRRSSSAMSRQGRTTTWPGLRTWPGAW